MATVPNIRALQGNTASFSGSSFTITLSQATASGSLIVIEFINNGSTTPSFITAISGGGTWTRRATLPAAASAVDIWEGLNVPSGVTSLSITCLGSISGLYSYGEFSGILPSSAFDTGTTGGIAEQTASSISITTSATATLAQEVELVLCVTAISGGAIGGSLATPSGYTQLTTGSMSGSLHTYFNYKIRATSVGTESATVTGGAAATVDAYAYVMCYKAVANVIQTRQNLSATSVTSIITTVPRPNNTLILAVSRAATSAAGTVMQTGAVWTPIVQATIAGQSCEFWIRTNTTGSEGTTITLGNACDYVFTEYYGLGTAPFDKSAVSSGAQTSTSTVMPSGTTATTSAALELALFCAAGAINNVSGSWSTILNGFVQVNATTSGGQAIFLAYSVLTSQQAVSTGVTLNPTGTGVNYTTALATFNPSGAASSASQLAIIGCG